MDNKFENLSMDELFEELVELGREKRMFEDSVRGCTKDTYERIDAIEQEIQRRFYANEKMN